MLAFLSSFPERQGAPPFPSVVMHHGTKAPPSGPEPLRLAPDREGWEREKPGSGQCASHSSLKLSSLCV